MRRVELTVSSQQTMLLSADRVVNGTQIAAIFDLFVGIDVHSVLEVRTVPTYTEEKIID